MPAFTYTAAGDTLVPGANPNPPSAVEIERLRGSLASMTGAIPEAMALLTSISRMQRQIGALLNTRASLMARIEEVTARYEAMRVGSAAQEAAGVPQNFAQLDLMLARSTDGLRNGIEDADRQILQIQARQRELFDMAARYAPSF